MRLNSSAEGRSSAVDCFTLAATPFRRGGGGAAKAVFSHTHCNTLCTLYLSWRRSPARLREREREFSLFVACLSQFNVVMTDVYRRRWVLFILRCWNRYSSWAWTAVHQCHLLPLQSLVLRRTVSSASMTSLPGRPARVTLRRPRGWDVTSSFYCLSSWTA